MTTTFISQTPLTIKPLLQPNKPYPPKTLVGSLTLQRRPPSLAAVRCQINNRGSGRDGGTVGESDHERVVFTRPSEIPWKKELCNAVHLIGAVGLPVQIRYLNSGKALAWTRLAVKKSASDTSWINLTFWDDLAHVAFQHVEKGQRIYVSGRIVSDTVDGDDGKPQTYYKVVVQQLNFVEKSFPQTNLYDSDTHLTNTGGKQGNYGGNSSGTIEEQWQAFFANPIDWWDNRRNKKNPKYPDFKHKDTGEALWIEGKYNPPWVKSQLALLDSRMGLLHAHEASTGSFTYDDNLTSF